MGCLYYHLGSAGGQRYIYLMADGGYVRSRYIARKTSLPQPKGKKRGEEDEPNLCIVWLHLSIGERAERVLIRHPHFQHM